jgi:beta-glucosidase
MKKKKLGSPPPVPRFCSDTRAPAKMAPPIPESPPARLLRTRCTSTLSRARRRGPAARLTAALLAAAAAAAASTAAAAAAASTAAAAARNTTTTTTPATPPPDLARLLPSSPPPSCTPSVRRAISWGVATSATQIEGGATAGGRTPSVWDAFAARSPSPVLGGATPAVAIDHYSRYEQDYDLMQRLGVKAHRFSISWTRLVPGGKKGSPVSADGVRYYRSLAHAMRERGIEPVATLYHWDLPQSLQDSYGGWLDRRVVDDFEYFAEAAFDALAGSEEKPLVAHWLTINEPGVICDQGYNQGTFAPGVKGGRKAMYQCGHNLLLAHARAVAVLRRVCPGGQCKASIAANVVNYDPLDPRDPAHARAAQNAMERESGWFLDPIVFGDYPPVLKRAAADAGLPAFTEAEKTALRGSFDFLAINTYTGYYAYPNPGRPDGYRITNATRGEALLEARRATAASAADGNTEGRDVSLLGSVESAIPGALGNALRYMGKRYGKSTPLWVTEFGVGVPGEHLRKGVDALKDADDRVAALATAVDGVCRAAASGDANVRAVFAWSFWDNYEWLYGYQMDFGLVDVEFGAGGGGGGGRGAGGGQGAATLTRTPKASAYWFSKYFWGEANGAPKLVP